MSKQSWTKFARFAKDIPERWKEAAFNNAFLKHHRNAQEIIYSENSKNPLVAIYVTPEGSNREDLKNLFRVIRERMSIENEQDTNTENDNS